MRADLRGGTVGGGRLKRRWLDRMRADLQGVDCLGRKSEKKVVGQSESRSLGGGTVGGGRLKTRWLDRVRADLRGRDCWGRKAEKKVVGQSESRSPGGLLAKEG